MIPCDSRNQSLTVPECEGVMRIPYLGANACGALIHILLSTSLVT